jgi:hypothetical protein
MDQLYAAVSKMVREGHLEFPPHQPGDLELGAHEPNQESQIQFHCLPFRMLTVGNKKANGRYIVVNEQAVFHDLQHLKVAKLAFKCTHPVEASVGILILCEYIVLVHAFN